MPGRTPIRLSWPRLAGIASGIFGSSLAVGTAGQILAADSFRGPGLPGLIISIFGCVFLFLALPLYAGREWSRRTLLLMIYAALATIAIPFSLAVFREASTIYASHPTRSLLIGLSTLVAVLTPAAFILAVLHHRDVRCAFQAPDASNEPRKS